MPSDLSAAIKDLLDRHQAHMATVREIDATLEQIEALVGGSNGRRRGPGRRRAAAEPGGDLGPKPKTPRRRGRGDYKETAEEMVLSFVRQHRNPTSREINAHWKSQGRPWSADVTVGKLVRDKKLKRTPLEGQRGSRYALV